MREHQDHATEGQRHVSEAQGHVSEKGQGHSSESRSQVSEETILSLLKMLTFAPHGGFSFIFIF